MKGAAISTSLSNDRFEIPFITKASDVLALTNSIIMCTPFYKRQDTIPHLFHVTDLLKKELVNIIDIKERLSEAMERVEDISQNSVQTTGEISASTEEQASGVENILKSMKNVQNGMEQLSAVLHTNPEEA